MLKICCLLLLNVKGLEQFVGKLLSAFAEEQ